MRPPPPLLLAAAVLLLLLVGGWPPAARGGDPLIITIASSELTLRTTASVDIQVCAGGVRSDERPAVQVAVVEALRFALGRTTAVYLVRQYTTNAGTACFLYVYQAPSPDDAALAEVLIRAAEAAGSSSSGGDNNNNNNNNNNDGQLLLTLTVNLDGQQRLPCAVTAVVWQGEDPPLPLWNASAADLIVWGGIAGGVLLACMLSACCFAALSRSEDARRAQALLDIDRAVLQRLLRAPRRAAGAPAAASAAASVGAKKEESPAGAKPKKKSPVSWAEALVCAGARAAACCYYYYGRKRRAR
jgi:hypothetical protein